MWRLERDKLKSFMREPAGNPLFLVCHPSPNFYSHTFSIIVAKALLLFFKKGNERKRLPFWEQQSAQRSLPGRRSTYRMMACCNSRNPRFTFGPCRPLSSKALINAPYNLTKFKGIIKELNLWIIKECTSLLLTKTEVQAANSSSSSAWKWYVRLSAYNQKNKLTFWKHSYPVTHDFLFHLILKDAYFSVTCRNWISFSTWITFQHETPSLM